MPPLLEALGHLLQAVAAVTLRRWRQGPRHPAWTFQTELFVTVQRRLTDASRTHPPQWLRAVQRAAPSVLPSELRTVRFTPVSAGGVACEWARPANVPDDAAPATAIVYFHGGGYVIGGLDTHREIVARLAAGTRRPVLAVDYRLAPEQRFPAAHDDCVAVVHWLRDAGTTRIALAGDSAGGALALGTLLALRDAGAPLPAGAALLCPWVEPLADGGSLQRNDAYDVISRDRLVGWALDYATEVELTGPRLSPVRAELAGLPPLLVQVGELEVLHDQIVALTDRARVAGVDVTLETYPAMFHDFQVAASIEPAGLPAVARLVAFLERVLG